jgi:hypothetical protein
MNTNDKAWAEATVKHLIVSVVERSQGVKPTELPIEIVKFLQMEGRTETYIANVLNHDIVSFVDDLIKNGDIVEVDQMLFLR